MFRPLYFVLSYFNCFAAGVMLRDAFAKEEVDGFALLLLCINLATTVWAVRLSGYISRDQERR